MNLQGKVKTMQKIEKLMGFVSLFNRYNAKIRGDKINPKEYHRVKILEA